MGLGITLRRAGIDSLTILEKAEGVGGVWRDNTYPGAACDVPSHLYSFSFEPNPEWTRRYSPQPEILDYLERCVENYGLGPQPAARHRGRGPSSTRARALADETTDGRDVEADVLVSACGQLSLPATTRIAGRSGSPARSSTPPAGNTASTSTASGWR